MPSFLALTIGEEPERGNGDQLRGVHVGEVADKRVVVGKSLTAEAMSECEWFSFIVRWSGFLA